MTREEVIEVLQQDIPCEYDRDLIEALNLAISALSAEGEYIKKSELLEKLTYMGDWNMDFYYVNEDMIHELPTYSFPSREKGTDLISRADTLKKICGKKCGCEFDECGFTEPCTYCQIINDMPSADREKGEWIEKEGWDGDVYYECSVCNEPWCTIEGTPWDNGMNFCPNCGVKMRKEEK